MDADKINFESALEDCKLVRESIKADDDFQNADSGLVLSYLDAIVLALEMAVNKKHDNPAKEGCWIPCSERMPDEDSYKWAVGITSTGRCIAFQEHNAYENDTGGISVPTYLAHGSEITHWMPIPEPPGGDNNA